MEVKRKEASMAVRLNEKQLKLTSYSMIPTTNQGKLLAFWCIAYGFVAIYVYKLVHGIHQQRFEEGLVSMCDQPARMLQHQFRVIKNAGYVDGSIVKSVVGQQLPSQGVEVYHKLMTDTQEDADVSHSVSHTRLTMLDVGDPFGKHPMSCSYLDKPPKSDTAFLIAILVYVIFVLCGYILYMGAIRIARVEDDLYEMQQLQKRSEAVHVAKSQFLAAVSHEIRTPMNGFLGMLALLQDTNLSSIQRDYAQTAFACGWDLITGIDDVLDTTKIESGKLELESVPFDIRLMLDDILSLFSYKSRGKGIELAVYVSDKVPEIVMGDPRRFRQVMVNLVENSVKFTQQGHVFVQVHHAEHLKAAYDAKAESFMNRASRGRRAVAVSSRSLFKTLSGHEAADDRNSWDMFKHLVAEEDEFPFRVVTTENVNLLVSVEDTGIGIPLHAQDSVFMPFMQAESSNSRCYGGVGLGLSISKRLVELMGGQMSFVSRPQIGSTISFTVTLNKCDKTSASDLPSDFEGLMVTVVDRKLVRAAVTRYHLQRLGLIVKIVDSIQMVVSLRSQNERPPDLLLVEKDMWLSNEDMSNIQLLNSTTNRPLLNLPKMILLATFITSPEFDKAIAAGFVDTVMMKPLRASMVAACLQQVLGTGKKAEPCTKGSLHLGSSLLCGKKILVVDDNQVDRRVAAEALKKFGAEVECADCGTAALALLQLPHGFDGCFMDLLMPEMDGYEVTSRVRMMESKANEERMTIGNKTGKWDLPILAMTADVVYTTLEECQNCGMDGYLSKPVEEESLYQAIAKFFEIK